MVHNDMNLISLLMRMASAMLQAVLLSIVVVFAQIAVVEAQEQAALSPKVVGGEEAAEGLFPWMVSIQDSAFGIHECGGTLISPRYVLTAAHCIQDRVMQQGLAVVIGGVDLSLISEGVAISVESFVIHPEYDDLTSENDIAILRLSRAVDETEPVVLATQEEVDEAIDSLLIGYGATEGDGSNVARLRQADLNVVGLEDCRNIYDSLGYQLESSVICAQLLVTDEMEGADACNGDSGGPLLIRSEQEGFKQIGLVSFGDPACDPERLPSVYTNVAQFQEFIALAMYGGTYSVDAGVVGQGRSVALTVLINSWVEQLALGQIESSDSSIVIDDDNCSQGTLLLEASCELSLTFSTQAFGRFEQSLRVLVDSGQPDFTEIIIMVKAWVVSELSASQVVAELGIDWYSGGEVPWQPDAEQVFVGERSLSSGSVLFPQRSFLSVYVPGGGFFNFRYKLDGVSADVLRVSVLDREGRRVGLASKNGASNDEWELVSFELPLEQTYQLLWSVESGAIERSQGAMAYLDDVSLTDQAVSDTPIVATPSSSGGAIGGSLLMLFFVSMALARDSGSRFAAVLGRLRRPLNRVRA